MKNPGLHMSDQTKREPFNVNQLFSGCGYTFCYPGTHLLLPFGSDLCIDREAREIM